MTVAKQAKIIEDIFRHINSLSQELAELQDEVVKLKPIEEEIRIVPKSITKTITPSVINDFHSFTNELINVRVKDNLIAISYIKSGQTATFNNEEVYDIFVNLPIKFDRAIVANCSRKLGIVSKNETLLMRFFIYQLAEYCIKTSKGSKDKLVIKKL